MRNTLWKFITALSHVGVGFCESTGVSARSRRIAQLRQNSPRDRITHLGALVRRLDREESHEDDRQVGQGPCHEDRRRPHSEQINRVWARRRSNVHPKERFEASEYSSRDGLVPHLPRLLHIIHDGGIHRSLPARSHRTLLDENAGFVECLDGVMDRTLRAPRIPSQCRTTSCCPQHVWPPNPANRSPGQGAGAGNARLLIRKKALEDERAGNRSREGATPTRSFALRISWDGPQGHHRSAVSRKSRAVPRFGISASVPARRWRKLDPHHTHISLTIGALSVNRVLDDAGNRCGRRHSRARCGNVRYESS